MFEDIESGMVRRFSRPQTQLSSGGKIPGNVTTTRHQKRYGGDLDSQKTLLSLFDFSGAWAKPFEDAGWIVHQWDIKLSEFMDINLIEDADTALELFEDINGIIAAPPCTDFSSSGAHAWKFKDEDGRTHKSVELVAQVQRLVSLFAPTDPEYDEPWFWAIENPVGRMGELTGLGKPWYFQPCEFAGWLEPSEEELVELNRIRVKSLTEKITRKEGDFVMSMEAYTKKTGIWGAFGIPKKKPLEPVYVTSSNGGRFSPVAWFTGGKSAKTKELRSNTPYGFAMAFYEANKDFRAQFQPGYWEEQGWSEKEAKKIYKDYNRTEPGEQKKLFRKGGKAIDNETKLSNGGIADKIAGKLANLDYTEIFLNSIDYTGYGRPLRSALDNHKIDIINDRKEFLKILAPFENKNNVALISDIKNYQAALKKWMEELSNNLHKAYNLDHTFTVYRHQFVDDDYLNNLKSGKIKQLGKYWAFSKEKAYSWEGSALKNEIKFEAKVKFDDVDFQKTAELHAIQSGSFMESELCLKDDAKISLLKADYKPYAFYYEPVKISGDYLLSTGGGLQNLKKQLRTNEAFEIIDADENLAGGDWIAGACHPLAHALQEIYGGDLVVIKADGLVQHVMVKIGDKYLDADGLQDKETKIKNFELDSVRLRNNWQSPPVITEFRQEECGGLGQGSKETIEKIKQLIIGGDVGKDNVIVYRGGENKDSGWVSDDKEHAENYGKAEQLYIPKNLNILDTDLNYNTFEELIDEYDKGGDYEEYKFEPPKEFIDFLKSKGYEGLQHETSSGNNKLIFDKSQIKAVKFDKGGKYKTEKELEQYLKSLLKPEKVYPKVDYNFRLIDKVALQKLPSASAIECFNGKLYIAGDDSPNLLIVDTDLRNEEYVRLFPGEGRIPKFEKHDIEASTIYKNHLLLVSSASLPGREVILDIPINAPEKFETHSTKIFFDRVREQIKTDINIEGMSAIAGLCFVFASRGHRKQPQNYLIATNTNFYRHQSDAPIVPIKLNFKSPEIGVSGLCYLANTDTLLFTASSEDSLDAILDGTIGNSHLGWINDFSQKINKKEITPDRMFCLNESAHEFNGEKIESICVEDKFDNSGRYIIHMVSDNDNGTSNIFKAVIKIKSTY